jgi:hypothetical protein
MTFDRRTLLKALAGLAGSAIAGPAAGQLPSAVQFAALSGALTGYPPDPDVAAKMLRALATPRRASALAALARLAATTPADRLDAAIAAATLDTVANDLVAAWYSGLVDGKVVTYTQAQMWAAMAFTKPMGVCGGVTGYWAVPPS